MAVSAYVKAPPLWHGQVQLLLTVLSTSAALNLLLFGVRGLVVLTAVAVGATAVGIAVGRKSGRAVLGTYVLYDEYWQAWAASVTGKVVGDPALVGIQRKVIQSAAPRLRTALWAVPMWVLFSAALVTVLLAPGSVSSTVEVVVLVGSVVASVAAGCWNVYSSAKCYAGLVESWAKLKALPDDAFFLPE